MYSVLPRFNAQRMLLDYTEHFYLPAIRHGRVLTGEGGQAASRLIAWKQRVAQAWAGLSMARVDDNPEQIDSGDALRLMISADLNGLTSEDVQVECVICPIHDDGASEPAALHLLVPEVQADGLVRYRLDLAMDQPGRCDYRVDAFPYHQDLAHRFEMGLMQWL